MSLPVPSIDKTTRYFDLTRPEARDALRLAIQSAAAAALTFVAMKTIGMPERFVGVLSAVMVVQPSAGAVMGEAKDRFLATLLGAVLGIICLTLLPSGYGTAVALGVSVFVLNWVAGFKKEWRYGVVAAVALALGSDTDMMQTAMDRSLAIGLGVLLGMVVALLVWPEQAERRALRHWNRAMQACAAVLQGSADMTTGKDADVDAERQRYRHHISAARENVKAIRLADDTAHSELIDAANALWNATIFLNRIGEEGDFANAGELEKSVASIADHAVSIIRHISGDETDMGDGDGDETGGNETGAHKILAELRDDVAQARRLVDDQHGDGDLFDRTARGALVFTLGEIVDSLERAAQARRAAAN